MKLFVISRRKLVFPEYTDSLLAAQAFIFFAAGYETSSTTMTNAFYELALNQKIQNRLREEIDQEYLKHNNLTYDNIKEMDYLDKVIRGTLWPKKFVFQKIESRDVRNIMFII